MVLTQISLSRFKQTKVSMLISHIYVSGFLANLFGDFGVYLGINTFSQRMLMEILNFEALMLFKK